MIKRDEREKEKGKRLEKDRKTKIRDEKVFGYHPQGGGGGGNHNSSFRFRLLHSSDSKAALNCVVVGLFPHPSDIRTEEKKFSRGSCDNLKVQI